MTDQTTRDAIIDLMFEVDKRFKQAVGGYSNQIDAHTIPGWVVVAAVDENCEPMVETYRWEFLEVAYKQAQEWLKTLEFDDPLDAWFEAALEVPTIDNVSGGGGGMPVATA